MLVRTKESANVGAAARAMLNFGLTDLWLVAPRCRIDHRAYALASHAEDVLKEATIVDELGDALVGMNLVAGTSARPRRAENYVVRSPREAAPELGGGSAVLFGPEDHGLSNEELTLCQVHVVIPTLDFSSLNLAQAVLVVAYEAALAAERPVGERSPATAAPTADLLPATRDQVEGFYGQLEEAMLLIGYTDQRRKPGIMRLFRGLFDRAAPTAHELAALRGLVSQASWAARLEPDRLPGRSDRDPDPGP
ncbi:MAG TPA: RNA methyltransferase [Trueperaceae bacterium]|nr:RNA methyltransferase [Trueperaceae bacterium]